VRKPESPGVKIAQALQLNSGVLRTLGGAWATNGGQAT